jgi:hypothetical protein
MWCRLKVPTAMIMEISVFWNVTPCVLVDKNQWFAGIGWFWLQGRRAKLLYLQGVAAGSSATFVICQISQRHFFAAVVLFPVEHIWLDSAKYETNSLHGVESFLRSRPSARNSRFFPPKFYGTRKFITVFTRAVHLSLVLSHIYSVHTTQSYLRSIK